MQVNDQGMQQEKSLTAISQWTRNLILLHSSSRKWKNGVKVINMQVKKSFFFPCQLILAEGCDL